MNGTVIAFDDGAGFGTVATADGARYRFHCVEIADGSRTIAVGTPVEFDTLRKLGAVEAACVRAKLTVLGREIVAVIASLQPGEVVSYGDVAHDAGHPGAARAVGAVLASTDYELPWWRVVRSDGRLVVHDPRRQAARLRAEGVTVRGGRVVRAPRGRFSRR